MLITYCVSNTKIIKTQQRLGNEWTDNHSINDEQFSEASDNTKKRKDISPGLFTQPLVRGVGRKVRVVTPSIFRWRIGPV